MEAIGEQVEMGWELRVGDEVAFGRQDGGRVVMVVQSIHRPAFSIGASALDVGQGRQLMDAGTTAHEQAEYEPATPEKPTTTISPLTPAKGGMRELSVTEMARERAAMPQDEALLVAAAHDARELRDAVAKVRIGAAMTTALDNWINMRGSEMRASKTREEWEQYGGKPQVNVTTTQEGNKTVTKTVTKTYHEYGCNTETYRSWVESPKQRTETETTVQMGKQQQEQQQSQQLQGQQELPQVEQ